ncbi:hypothetical protein AAVH_28283 [Aphelenchoides avenae]|nr:hypothetical protein AAVH_28283 [Aphelenchus avenae]
MTAIYDYHQQPSPVCCSPYYSSLLSAPKCRAFDAKQRNAAKPMFTFRRVVRKLLSNRLMRMLLTKNAKTREESIARAAFRQRTVSENSRQSSILSDYDAMPTILEETDEEVVAEVLELLQSGYCYCGHHAECDEEFYEAVDQQSVTV